MPPQLQALHPGHRWINGRHAACCNLTPQPSFSLRLMKLHGHAWLCPPAWPPALRGTLLTRVRGGLPGLPGFSSASCSANVNACLGVWQSHPWAAGGYRWHYSFSLQAQPFIPPSLPPHLEHWWFPLKLTLEPNKAR